VPDGPRGVAALVAAIEPFDDVERGHWWTGPQIESADPARLDPNMGRFLAKLRGQPRG
jgi:hypothetical protein